MFRSTSAPTKARTHETETDPNGQFRVAGMLAVDRMQPERLSNPTFARRIAAGAALVNVTEGATISIKPPPVRADD